MGLAYEVEEIPVRHNGQTAACRCFIVSRAQIKAYAEFVNGIVVAAMPDYMNAQHNVQVFQPLPVQCPAQAIQRLTCCHNQHTEALRG